MGKEKGEGFSKVRSKARGIGDDLDTEGHATRARGTEPESFSKVRFSKVRGAGDENDTEGHALRVRSPSSRGE